MFRNPHSALNPEDVDLNTLYSVSINPKQQFDDRKSSSYLKRFSMMIEYVHKWLDHGQDYFSYVLFPECKNGRIHFHGVIKFIQPLKFDMLVLPLWKELWTYEIDTIDDINVWFKYCTKQQSILKITFPELNKDENHYYVLKRKLKVEDFGFCSEKLSK